MRAPEPVAQHWAKTLKDDHLKQGQKSLRLLRKHLHLSQPENANIPGT